MPRTTLAKITFLPYMRAPSNAINPISCWGGNSDPPLVSYESRPMANVNAARLSTDKAALQQQIGNVYPFGHHCSSFLGFSSCGRPLLTASKACLSIWSADAGCTCNANRKHSQLYCLTTFQVSFLHPGLLFIGPGVSPSVPSPLPCTPSSLDAPILPS